MAKLPSAIDFISNLQNEMRTREFTSVNEAQAQNYLSEYVCVEIIKALQKQIPKKPKRIGTMNMYSICPICSGTLLVYDFCPHCGQKIDWQNKQSEEIAE